MKTLRRRLVGLIPPLILLAGVALRLADPPVVEQFRLMVFDEYQRLNPRPYADVPVRIADLDDETLSRFGQWPWPRTLVARLVERLSELGAAVIAFDVVFAEPDRTSPSQILPLWAEQRAPPVLLELGRTLPDHDRIFAQAIAASNVVAGFVLNDKADDRMPAAKFGLARAGDDPLSFLPRFSGAVLNLPVIETAAAGNGSFNQVAESDGIIRRAPLLLRLDDQIYPALAAEALRVAQGARGYVVKASGASGELAFGASTGVNSLRIGQFIAPTDPNGRLWIHYTRPAPEREIPIWRIFEPDFDARKVEGAIVFIGTSAAGLKDIRATPLNPAAAGVEVHAAVVEQILLGSFLERPDWVPGAELLYLVALGLILFLLLPRWGSLWCALIAVAAIGASAVGSGLAFGKLGLLIDPVYPSLFVVAIYLASSLIVYLRTEAERRQVRGAFSRYMSPALVDQLAANPDKLKLGGETRNMTLLFCDIRGFTTISEQFDAEGLTSFINRFLTPMTGIILERRGTIDKYMGDAIMAFWNAPLDDPAHATHACDSALAMMEGLKALNVELEREAAAAGRRYIPIAIGAGLNSGDCCVGNMGSDQRFDYSVLGDDVNLASRLEGQSKTYGVNIVIGENTAAQIHGYAVLELDLIKVKGKTKPVRIFTLHGEAAIATDPVFLDLARRHEGMLGAYRAQRWDQAESLIAECRALAGDRLDGLYDLYAERIADFRASPPGPDWDGVYVATSK